MIPRPPAPFPTRGPDATKYTCGNVLVVAGARGMTGAAFLAAKGCLRSGAGLVTLAAPGAAHDALEVKTTCIMTRRLPETDEGTLAQAALDPLLALLDGRDALAVGPGLSRHPETEQVIRGLVARVASGGPPLVLDADGLNAFEGRAGDLCALAGRLVLTPHPGELRRLLGCGREALEGERREPTVRAFAEELGATVLLKGHRTLVVAPREPTYVNQTGNPGMATAGAGDVLTGVIAALLAQGLGPFPAACLGAYLHGLAGDAAARRTGWAPLIASDLLDGLVEVIRGLEVRG